MDIAFSMTHAFAPITYRKIIPSFHFLEPVYLCAAIIIALLFDSIQIQSDNNDTILIALFHQVTIIIVMIFNNVFNMHLPV